MKRLITLAIAMVALAVGCRAQVPPATQYAVSLSWNAPAANANWGGCTTSSPCVYSVYRCTASATACADTSNVGWQEITTSANRPNATSYTDTTAQGTTPYYVVETVQGTAHSGPSNTVGPFTLPPAPGAPGTVTGATQTAALAPPLVNPQSNGRLNLAMAAPGNLRVR